MTGPTSELVLFQVGARTFAAVVHDAVRIGSVRVSCSPHMVGRRGKNEVAVRVEFAAGPDAEKSAPILAHLMRMAGEGSGWAGPPGAFEVQVARTGKVFRASSSRSRLTKDIEAACATIEQVWPGL